MGSIRNLINENVNTHILLTSSSLAEMYIYDTLKDKCKATRDGIYNVETKSGVDTMLELVNIQPFLAEKWLFILNYAKVKRYIKDRQGIFDADTSEFLIKVKNYKEYKEVKELIGKANDIYLTYLKFSDVDYILRDYELSENMKTFIKKSYSSEPDKVFTLMKAMNTGTQIPNKRAIVNACGVSAGSLSYFAISLLNAKVETDRGKKMSCKKKMSVAVELAETYGYSKMRNFLMACVKDMLDIKQLYMVGAIYDKISGLPDVSVIDVKGDSKPVYDEKRLSRYNMQFKSIIEIPYEKFVKLYIMLKKCGKWYSATDMMRFVYDYYESL